MSKYRHHGGRPPLILDFLWKDFKRWFGYLLTGKMLNAVATDSIGVSYTEDYLKRIGRELHTTALEIEPCFYGYVGISFLWH